MKMKYVLVPVLRGIVSVHLQKGNHWSAVEHLVLYATCDAPKTLDRLAEDTAIHTSVLSEIISRLTTVGWIELHQSGSAISFQATPAGMVEAQRSTLTPVTRLITKKLYFDVDCITWTMHKAGGFAQLLYPDTAEERYGKNQSMTYLEMTRNKGPRLDGLDLLQMISEHDDLLKLDERISGYNPDNSSIDLRYANISVAEGIVEGIPKTQSEELRRAIVAASSRASSDNHGAKKAFEVDYDISGQQTSSKIHPVTIAGSDIIVGGPAHKSALEQTLSTATRNIVIASTFIRDGAIEELLPDIRRAARRGVEVYLLWEASNDKDHRWTSNLNVPENVRFLGVGSGSHAKLILADDGSGHYYSIVGSCNWLYSNFVPTEVSVRLRSPAIVAECIQFLDRAVKDSASLREALCEMHQQTKSLSESSREFSGSEGTAQLVLAPDQPAVLHKARDNARTTIMLASQRLGDTVEAQGLVALASAAKRGVSATVYYKIINKKSALGNIDKSQLQAIYPGVNIIKVRRETKTHAKLLCWDEDDALITSLNWLSKNALSGSDESELGVYLSVPGVGKTIREQYEALVKI